jgi:hypothetical protein
MTEGKKNMIKFNQIRDFRITHHVMDGQFNRLKNDLGHLGIMLNIASPNGEVQMETYQK